MFSLLPRFRKPKITIETIRSIPFQPWHEDECKRIWREWVPKMGQSAVVQGELLRAVEKLCYEALDNGNINWNDQHVRLCSFLRTTLMGQSCFTRAEKARFAVILDFLRANGEYVRAYNEGEIDEDAVDVARFPDEQDEKLYDILRDAVGKLTKTHPAPIPREIDPELYI